MATLYLPKREFTPIPEGVHIFRIYDVEYDVTFGKVRVYLVNAKGRTHRADYNTLNNDGSVNETASNALAYLARSAINDNNLMEIDHTQLINKYIQTTITHTVQPNRNDPSKTVTFINLSETKPADGFDTEPCEKALTLGQAKKEEPTPAPQADAGAMNLDSLLD